MKRLSLYVFLFLMFSIFTSHSFAAKKHKIYKKLPCNFNGVKVSTSAQFHDGVKGGRCCPKCSGYKLKRGTSIIMKRGTPIVAIADMKLISIYDISAHQKSKKKSESAGKKDRTDHYQSQKTKNYPNYTELKLDYSTANIFNPSFIKLFYNTLINLDNSCNLIIKGNGNFFSSGLCFARETSACVLVFFLIT